MMKLSLAFAVLCFAAPLLSQEAAPPAPSPSRPNILFVFADDWGRYASAYAKVDGRPTLNDVVRTPNVDRVAKEGVLFRNAFVTSPSCTPCRSSLLSGQYFFRTGRGAILQGASWDTSIPSFPLLLRDEGYHIGKTAKVWSPGTPADAPFGGQEYAFQNAGNRYNNFSENVTKLVEGGTTVGVAREKMLAEVRGNFSDFLKANATGKPWLYWFGTTTTHRTWIKGSGKKLWGIEPDSLAGKLPPFLPDVPEVREDVADYLGEVQAVDAYMGVLLKMLEEAGQLENTLVIVSGDHGMPGVPNGKCNLYDHGTAVTLAARVPGGKGGRVVDDFVNLMDLAPTFCEVGGVTPPQVTTGRSFWSVLKSDKSGQVDAERTFVVTGRERHVAAAREDNLPYPQRALRTKGHLYIRNFHPERWPLGAPNAILEGPAPDAAELTRNTHIGFADMDAGPTKAWLVAHRADAQGQAFYERAFMKRPGEELYDLSTDPYQMKNLAADASHAAVKDKMAADLMKVLTNAQDPRVTGDQKAFERPPFTDPNPAGDGRQKKKGKGPE